MNFDKTWTPQAADTDGYANDVTAASGVAFTLITDTTTDGLAHKIIITPSGSVTGDYIISGTDSDGNSQTESLATDTVNAVTSAKYYKSSIVVKAPSGLGGNTVDIGWTAVAVTQTIPLEKLATPPAVIQAGVSGTINFSVQETAYNFSSWPQTNGLWSSITALASKTGDTTGSSTQSMQGLRGLVNSVTAGATLRLTVAQGVF